MRRTPHPRPPRSGLRTTLPTGLAGALAVALGLGGCVAGSQTTRSTLGASAGAPTASPTASLPTEAASLAGRAPDPDAQPVPTGEGVPGDELAAGLRSAMAAKGSVRMLMTTAAGSADAQVDTRSKAMRVAVDAGGRAVTLVHLGERTWVKGAGTVERQVPPTRAGGRPTTDVRRWLLLAPDGSDEISRRLGSQAKVAESLDPARFTALMEGLLGDRTPRGDGAQVVFTVPAAQYADVVQAPAGLRSQITKAVRLVVVVDGAGLPTSVTTTVPTADGEITDRTEYSRWGEPVEVQAPSEDDVAPAPGTAPAVGGASPSSTGRGAMPGPTGTRTGEPARRSPSATSAPTSSGTASSTAPRPSGSPATPR